MKRVLRFFAVVALAMMVNTGAEAQLPDGSVAPNFTVTDLDGQEHTLYDYLDAGIPVVIDFSATWCGPCWSYHTGAFNGYNGEGALHHLYSENGPDGTNEVMVLYLEADDTTTGDDLLGTGTNTAGDWVTGTPYPICDNTGDIFDQYQCTAYPTILTICPNRLLTATGQGTYENHIAFVQENACDAASQPVDPSLISYSGDLATCSEIDAVVGMMNFGTDNLMSAQVTVTGCDNCPIVEDWTGDLATYSVEDITISGLAISADTDLDISITSMNDNTGNDTWMQAVSMAEDASTHFRVEIMTDCWPEETTWEIVDENGATVASGGPYADAETMYVEDRWVDGTGCFGFRFMDSYGDGLNGEAWTSCGVNGSATCTTMDGGSEFSMLWDYDGSYWIETAEVAANVVQTVSIENLETQVSFNVFPNPVNDVANVQFAVSNASEVTLNVMNMLGQTVYASDLGTVLGGEHRTEIDFSALEGGMYLVNLTANGETQTLKVTVTK
jgi:thiol-disulfide isomerase/thioredoxin